MRRKGQTLGTISKKMSLSSERIRQICSENSLIEFYKKLEQEYIHKMDEADYAWLKSEVKELTKKDRGKAPVIRRREFVRYLHDVLDMPFYKIGNLLHRHHTSISHLYYK